MNDNEYKIFFKKKKNYLQYMLIEQKRESEIERIDTNL